MSADRQPNLPPGLAPGQPRPGPPHGGTPPPFPPAPAAGPQSAATALPPPGGFAAVSPQRPLPPPAPGGWGGHPGAPGGWPPPYAGPRNATGTAALVLGVIAATLCWTFVFSVLGLVLGVLAVILGLIGTGRARRGTATNRGVALGGVWTGAGAAAVSAVLTVLFVIWVTDPIVVESEAGSAHLAGAGDEVVFEDGLVVSLAAPERDAADGTVTITVRIANEGGGEADLDGAEFDAFVNEDRLGEGQLWRGADWPATLASGASAEVDYRVELPTPETAVVSVDFAPGDEYEFAFWDLDLPGGGSGGDPDDGSGDTGGSGGVEA
ncbi:hypothetical protein [Streptomyces litchfieldiae]|uniref:DUF4190 domain-containing protein n=1 Tax=Streptomyces litchfieldiae TaxID=3075543 RepID=A0ABU2MHQ0_9ACTN|nr:hypothetical protein [Streptomyces sp. DSM 44938]MDT0341117.1 hypothetical protein [Streptomyces sp. DSM 44938]